MKKFKFATMLSIVLVCTILFGSIGVFAETNDKTKNSDAKALLNEEKVTKVYSLDYKNRLYFNVTDTKKINTIVSKLESQKEDEVVEGESCVGFLIFTDKGKHSYYFDSATKDNAKKDLAKLSTDCNKAKTGIPQWLAYMSVENIERITYSGVSGKDRRPFVYATVDTKSQKAIEKVAAFLKKIEVSPKPTFNKGSMNITTDGSYYTLTLFFKSGVKYRIVGTTSDLSIYATDFTNDRIDYESTQKQIDALRNMMTNLDDAVVSDD